MPVVSPVNKGVRQRRTAKESTSSFWGLYNRAGRHAIRLSLGISASSSLRDAGAGGRV
jgi:hypothetical protein